MQSAAREERMTAMLQLAIDEKFFRPSINPNHEPQSAIVDHEGLSDVTNFDEAADGEIIDTEQKLQKEFSSIFREQFNEEPPSERHQD